MKMKISSVCESQSIFILFEDGSVMKRTSEEIKYHRPDGQVLGSLWIDGVLYEDMKMHEWGKGIMFFYHKQSDFRDGVIFHLTEYEIFSIYCGGVDNGELWERTRIQEAARNLLGLEIKSETSVIGEGDNGN